MFFNGIKIRERLTISELQITTKPNFPPIHPGEYLAEDLEALGMSASQFAKLIKVPTNRVTEILNGERGITADTALRLSYFFGTSADIWLRLQNTYELRKAELENGEQI